MPLTNFFTPSEHKVVLSSRFEFLGIFVLAVGLVTVNFLLQENIDINLSDEGYLWYGTVRTAIGEVPLRDFQSYDPGRYLWGALWFKLLDSDRLLTLRLSNAIFQTLGLTFGLLSVRRLTRSPWLLTLAGLVLLLWMFPRHKLFESSISMAAVYFAVLLLEKPSLRRYFTVGCAVGLSAFFGRNHGFYTFASFAGLIGFIWLKFDRKALLKHLLSWGTGILVGYSPALLMMALIPGFWDGFNALNQLLIRLGKTNLPLPVPWFWRASYTPDLWLSSHIFSVGCLFLILPFFNGIFLVYLLCQKRDFLQRHLVLISATFLSLTYTHYAFSRADLPHLSQAIHPMLIGWMATIRLFSTLSWKKISLFLSVSLAILTVTGIVIISPLSMRLRSPSGSYVVQKIGGDRLSIPRGTANLIRTIQQINLQQISSQEEILVGPHIPAIYPILQRKSPLWDIYFLFPETEKRQQAIIQELHQKKVNWVLLGDVALDNRENLRFKNTHPLVWQHFKQAFQIIENKNLPSEYQLMHRK
ncbi:MAG: hypothetical protein KME16_14750 [Scytolyngbya sp. HA4215-MV1]|nr:hypothetical protein [Scytolyngbya sp. HA4215-MV1]